MDKKNSHLTARELTKVALSAAFLTVCSWIAIPTGDIPVTLQTFAIFVISGLLGTKLSMMALLVYILMGLVGLPVFSGMAGGLGHILGPTGGYLLGFFFTILTIGAISRYFGRKPVSLALSMALGMAACYAFGSLWFAAVYMGDPDGISLQTALLKCVLPYILPDCAKIGVAVMVIRRLSAILSS